MIKTETSVTINRPIEEVFDFVTTIENNPQWQSSTLEAKRTSEGPIGVGTTSLVELKFLGRRIEAAMEITEYEPNKKVSFKTTSGPTPATGSNTFEALSEGETKVTFLLEADVGGFFKLAEPLVARASKRDSEANAATLKDILEAQAEGVH